MNEVVQLTPCVLAPNLPHQRMHLDGSSNYSDSLPNLALNRSLGTNRTRRASAGRFKCSKMEDSRTSGAAGERASLVSSSEAKLANRAKILVDLGVLFAER